MPAEPIDLKYAAGFFDGEGYLGVRYRHSTDSYHPTVAISQKYPSILYRFQARWGGNVYSFQESRFWSWRLTTKGGIRKFLQDIIQLLEEKHPQAIVLLSFLCRWPTQVTARGPEAAAMAQELKDLKRKPACPKLS